VPVRAGRPGCLDHRRERTEAGLEALDRQVRAPLRDRVEVGHLVGEGVRAEARRPAAHQVPGTRTEKLEYYDRSGHRLAIAIQYVRPDGNIGASGLPDPKSLYDGARALIPSHKDNETCPDCAP
jgi:hypothetical protein